MKQWTYIKVNQKHVSPHELTTALHISRLRELQQPSLNDAGALAGLQVGEEDSRNCHNNTIQYIRGGWLTNEKDSHIYTDFTAPESRDRRIEDLIVGVWIDENKHTKTITYSVSVPWRRWRVIVAVKRNGRTEMTSGMKLGFHICDSGPSKPSGMKPISLISRE